MIKMNKILVTGGCGYIGSHTVVELIENNFDVTIIDDLSNSNEKIVNQIEQITGIKPHFVKLDLKSQIDTEIFFKTNNKFDAVIHFAAYKAVGESVKQPIEYYKNNLVSIINLLEHQQKNNCNSIIFSSSATVYGEPKQLPITEKEVTKRPFSPYGNTKKIAEEILEDCTIANQEFSAIALRYFNPIGAHASGLIGELPNGIPNNLMPYITQTASGIREKLMVFGNDYPTNDGTAIRDYIHVVDLAQAHVKAVKRLLDKKQKTNFEVFNLGTGNGYSVLEIITTFEKVNNLKLNYEIAPRRDGDVPMLFASTDFAEIELNWKAKYNLEEMIESSWKWEQYYQTNKNFINE